MLDRLPRCRSLKITFLYLTLPEIMRLITTETTLFKFTVEPGSIKSNFDMIESNYTISSQLFWDQS